MSTKEQLPSGLKTFYRGIKTPEHRKEFLELFYYIKRVSEDFDVTLSEVQLLDIFGIDTKKLPSKAEINKKLFEVAKAADIKERIIGDFNPVVVSSATSSFFNKSSTKDQLLRTLRNQQLLIQNYHQEIRTLVRQMYVTKEEIDKVEKIDTSDLFVREMNKIISSNRFEQIYFHTRNSTICALTKPVTLKHAEKEYSLGQFIIAFYCADKKFNVLPYRNNINAEGMMNHYHPHVFDSKDICWGNAGASYSELMNGQRIGDLFLIADMILHSYNQDSPVTEISRFNRNPVPVGRTTYNSNRMYEQPIHLQTIMDWFPDMKEDKMQFDSYAGKYINIHNFKYSWPEPVQETSSDDLDVIEITVTSETLQEVA